MPLPAVLMLCLLGIGIAMFRRSPQAFLDGPSSDVPAMLLNWAVGLLSDERAEWGQAMLGELGYIDGRIRRLRFAVGCVIAALLLPPWGRAAAGVWAMIAIAAGSVGLYASLAIRFGLDGADWVNWVWAAIAIGSLAGFVLGASALLRRPGVVLPGLLGGLAFALVSLIMTGFTFYEVTGTITTFQENLILRIGVPFAVGIVGTLWRRDAAVGRRIARLAAVSSGLILYLYSTLAVVVLGAGGPPDDPGLTGGGIVSDRLGNNLIDLLLGTLLTATVGWAGAASVARLRPSPPGPVLSGPVLSGPVLSGPFTPAASPDPQQEA
jgi:hypothetical protein